MNKDAYLQQLSALLTDLSSAEREEALLYYRDYIEDAGVENEATVLKELGTPEKLAKDIKQGLGINTQQANTSDIPFSNYQGGSYPPPPAPNKTNKPNLTGGQIALIVFLLIISSPIWGSILAAVLSFIATIFAVSLSIFIALAAIGISFIICFFALLLVGISKMLITPLVSFFLIGIGAVLGGIGIFSLLLCGIICTRFVPWFCKCIASLWNSIFHNKSGRRMTV